MKIYALKYKNEVIKLSDNEFGCQSDYRWERDELKKNLTIVYGTFTEEGTVEFEKLEEKVGA